MTHPWGYRAYGLAIHADRVWPGLEPALDVAASHPPVTVRAGGERATRALFSGQCEAPRTLLTADGPLRALRGHEHDRLLDGGTVAVFHLSAAGDTLTYATTDAQAPGFIRMLLDTALGTAALMRGHEGLHAAAVTVGERLIAIAAPRGTGKTSLAAAAVRAGAVPYTDDLLFLSDATGALLAHPGPALMNVPADEPPIGRVISELRGERLVIVAREPPPALAPALIAFLVREPGAGSPVAERESSPARLLSHGLDSGPRPERQRRRLSVLGSLAAATPMIRLRAGTDVTPDALAQALLAQVPR